MKEFAWEHNMPLKGKVLERLKSRWFGFQFNSEETEEWVQYIDYVSMQFGQQIKQYNRHQEHCSKADEFSSISMAEIEDVQTIPIPDAIVFNVEPNYACISEHVEDMNEGND